MRREVKKEGKKLKRERKRERFDEESEQTTKQIRRPGVSSQERERSLWNNILLWAKKGNPTKIRERKEIEEERKKRGGNRRKGFVMSHKRIPGHKNEPVVQDEMKNDFNKNKSESQKSQVLEKEEREREREIQKNVDVFVIYKEDVL